jgi:hypothetical protein
MAITLELPPYVEASLTAQARARGLLLNTYLLNLLKQRAATERPEHTRSAEEFEAELDALAAYSAKIPLLPLKALIREAIYRDHD